MDSRKLKKILSKAEIVATSDYEEIFRGSLPDIFKQALVFIMNHLFKIQGQKSVNSIGDPEVPRIVFEELLLNALIHRDYFISAPVRLFVFDDRIEIINPGNLPDHLTTKKICAPNPTQRNPILTSISKELFPCYRPGRGIRRALKAWPHINFFDDRNLHLFTSVIRRPELRRFR